jgi:protease-4
MRRMKRILAAVGCLFLVGLAVGAAGFVIAIWGRGHSPVVGDSLLTLELKGSFPERPEATASFLPGFEVPRSFATLYRLLRQARQEGHVKGLVVTIDGAGFGFAQAQEVRRQLLALRAAGKSVDCYLETIGEGRNGSLDYYLASACQTISLSPVGEVNLLGLYADSFFLRRALDKLRIDPQFRHAGQYKSANELFTETAHSAPAREALGAFLDSLYEQLLNDIGAARGKDAALLGQLFDRAPLEAAEALQLGLVDALQYPDEFRDAITKRTDDGAQRSLWSLGSTRLLRRGKTVAVLFAEGEILRGESSVDPWANAATLGSADLGKDLRALAEDDSVAAVVLRVASPGGSALASDLILREVAALKGKKPVVASFSDLAASGGYYIACKASKIVAEPGSLTGSIGVVAGKLVTRRFQEELLGVTHDELKRGANADFFSSVTPFSADQDALFQRQLERVYRRFVDHVAEGRAMTREAVENVAAGRIWTGKDALARGLVDELGGLDRAIALAAELAQIGPGEEISLRFLPEPPDFFDLLRRGSSWPRVAALERFLARLERPAAGRLELTPEQAVLAHPF